MTDQPLHQVHLQSAQQQQQQLLGEIQELNKQVEVKKELVLKVQGVIEYLTQLSSTDIPQDAPVEDVKETVTTEE
tara:strand:+ start:249 stop:473 length:225 start_codon:yes stop_codon:yes gene_type:complete